MASLINELIDDISNTTPDRTEIGLEKISIGRLSKIQDSADKVQEEDKSPGGEDDRTPVLKK